MSTAATGYAPVLPTARNGKRKNALRTFWYFPIFGRLSYVPSGTFLKNRLTYLLVLFTDILRTFWY